MPGIQVHSVFEVCKMLLNWVPFMFHTHHDSFLQTAECLVVGELATKDMVVVLNKVDQLPEEGRSKVINKAKKRLRQTLGSTKFGGCAMVSTAVKPGIRCTLSLFSSTCACFVPLSLEYSIPHVLNKKNLLSTDAVGAQALSLNVSMLAQIQAQRFTPLASSPKLCAVVKPSSTCVPCHMFSTGNADTPSQTQGIEEVIQEIVKCVSPHPQQPSGPFKFAIDHCFAIRGQGTVLTGTVLSGSVKVGDSIELPELKVCAHQNLSCRSLTSPNLC